MDARDIYASARKTLAKSPRRESCSSSWFWSAATATPCGAIGGVGEQETKLPCSADKRVRRDPHMGSSQSQGNTQDTKPPPQLGKSGKKICCSCPETKKPRDECIVTKGEEHCGALIEAHKRCLRLEGFKV